MYRSSGERRTDGGDGDTVSVLDDAGERVAERSYRAVIPDPRGDAVSPTSARVPTTRQKRPSRLRARARAASERRAA